MRNKKGRKVRSGFGKALILLHNYNQRNRFLKGTPGASYLPKGFSVWLRKKKVYMCLGVESASLIAVILDFIKSETLFTMLYIEFFMNLEHCKKVENIFYLQHCKWLVTL